MRFNEILEKVKVGNPLINNITNPVTMNDCANAQLAIGASPMMSSLLEEMEEVGAVVQGFNFNIGAIHSLIPAAIFKAAKVANKLDKPIILDPVGVGISQFRKSFIKELLEQYQVSVIKGNLSEIKTIDNFELSTRGVDAHKSDQVSSFELEDIFQIGKRLSKRYQSIIVITGKVDIIIDGDKVFLISNGHEMMSKVTGSGCVLSALIAAFIGSKKASDSLLEEVLTGVGIWGLAGEIGYQHLKEYEGSGFYMKRMIDSLNHMGELNLNELIICEQQ